MTACIRYRPIGHPEGARCIVANQHLPSCVDCTCTCHQSGSAYYAPCSIDGGCYIHHQNIECGGCLPAPAEHGQLCHRDHERLLGHLGGREHLDPVTHGIDWMYDLMRSSIEQGTPKGARSEAMHTKAESAPVAFNIRAMAHSHLIADNLDRHVWIAADLLGHEQPGRHWPAENIQWLHHRLDAIENLTCGWAAYLLDDLNAMARTAHAIQPWRAGQHRWRGIPCPICHTTGSVITPGGETDPRCDKCHAVFPADHWNRWQKYLIEENQKVA